MRTYIIAEAGVNHNGSVDLAKELIRTAAKAGADAVKFQTFQAEDMVSRNAAKADYQLETTDRKETQLDMLRKLELPHAVYPELMACCQECGIAFLSTPFEDESLRFLVEKCHLDILKISSGEITNGPFLLQVARTGKDVILSTGMSTLGEVEMALGALAFGYLNDREPSSAQEFVSAYTEAQTKGILKEKVRLLHCTTEYPAPLSEVNLAAMDTMRRVFDLSVGYSDHTEGIAVPLAAVARGASIIEKHFTLDCSLSGPDHKASLEPGELTAMVQGIRQVEQAIGTGVKAPGMQEQRNIPIARKSLVASIGIKKGETFSPGNVTAKRPGNGISPMRYWELLGTASQRDYATDEIL